MAQYIIVLLHKILYKCVAFIHINASLSFISVSVGLFYKHKKDEKKKTQLQSK